MEEPRLGIERPAPRVSRSPTASLLLAAAAGLAAGCSTESYSRDADRSVERILPAKTDEVLGARESAVLHPKLRDELAPGEETAPEGAASMAEDAAEEDTGDGAGVRVISLREALSTAIGYNRDYESRLEDLYLTTLGLVGTRHVFSPLLSSVLSYLFVDSDRTSPADSGQLSLSVSQILPTGGVVSASAATGFADSDASGVEALYDSSVSVQLTQPLLRGAGHEASHEPLVQAERNLIYSIREFELFRQVFSIDVARRYYSLVESKRSIANQRSNMEKFTFARKKAEALFNVGRANELNFLRAKRQELNSLNALIEAEENYELELDRFRIFLGLPEGEQIEVVDEAPAFVPVAYDVDSAVEVALENRLDVLNEREQLEDVERNVRLAKNGLLPDLDVSLSYLRSAAPATRFGSQELEDDDYSAAVTLGIPIDRVAERNSYRSAEIALARAQRSFEEFLDTIEVTVQGSVRELVRRRQSVEIQEELIHDEEKNLRIAELQFEQGLIDNRDVVEANESLLDAKNRLISEQVNYEIARLSLLGELGILFIDEQGMWKE